MVIKLKLHSFYAPNSMTNESFATSYHLKEITPSKYIVIFPSNLVIARENRMNCNGSQQATEPEEGRFMYFECKVI